MGAYLGSTTAPRAVLMWARLADLAATAAAAYRRDGWQGARLLTNADLATAVREAQQARSDRTEITADAVVAELAKLGFANMADYIT